MSGQRLFIAKVYQHQLDSNSFFKISKEYATILNTLNFKNYFAIFEKSKFQIVIEHSSSLLEICVAVELNDGFIYLTPTLEFEHD
jgi:hypothetical protein